ncbi:uncharacterized protein N7479_000606 [Penicillium vulpinum]|uniref:uncharacterized protein n=1 Tax=Penicillium vulpinum TaxID=29845 RepID=UPI002547DE33|nr:uncharacterized protein N7479_000606 [Penicillium vulpinum]KAJ5970688.1 hypothetical protein N7479_000606 [Penicillium vulpinum]
MDLHPAKLCPSALWTQDNPRTWEMLSQPKMLITTGSCDFEYLHDAPVRCRLADDETGNENSKTHGVDLPLEFIISTVTAVVVCMNFRAERRNDRNQLGQMSRIRAGSADPNP